jgi:hypothetical protein
MDTEVLAALLGAFVGAVAGGMTSCMPCSFGSPVLHRSRACAQQNGPLAVTVIDRQVPPVTAACGTRVARPVRTRMFTTWRRRLQLGCWVGLVRGEHRFVAKSPEGSRQLGGETRTPPHLPGGCLLTATAGCSPAISHNPS